MTRFSMNLYWLCLVPLLAACTLDFDEFADQEMVDSSACPSSSV